MLNPMVFISFAQMLQGQIQIIIQISDKACHTYSSAPEANAVKKNEVETMNKELRDMKK